MTSAAFLAPWALPCPNVLSVKQTSSQSFNWASLRFSGHEQDEARSLSQISHKWSSAQFLMESLFPSETPGAGYFLQHSLLLRSHQVVFKLCFHHPGHFLTPNSQLLHSSFKTLPKTWWGSSQQWPHFSALISDLESVLVALIKNSDKSNSTKATMNLLSSQFQVIVHQGEELEGAEHILSAVRIEEHWMAIRLLLSPLSFIQPWAST